MTTKRLSIYTVIVLIVAVILRLDVAMADAIPSQTDPNGNIWWGGEGSTPNDPNPIHDRAPAASGLKPGQLVFCWTKGEYQGAQSVCHPGYDIFAMDNPTAVSLPFKFHRPQNDNTITDWKQFVVSPDGQSKVYGGNIQQDSPWLFHPLSELPTLAYRIPDLAPTTGDPDDIIFCAVNLGMYFSMNPTGFLDGYWEEGQTLNELGVSIVDGQVSGLHGIYWATTDFTFDSLSETGYVPAGGDSAWLNSDDYQAEFGDIQVLAQHRGNYGLPTGACSIGEECYTALTEHQCESMGGNWQGEGTTCEAPGVLRFDDDAYYVHEYVSHVTFTVFRTGGSDGEVSVDYQTIPGTATPGVDYVATSGTLIWPDGDMSPKTFPVSIVNDEEAEDDETIYVELSNPTGGATLGTPSQAQLTILDDEPIIPTLSQWVLIVLALSVAVFFVWQLMRKRRAAASV